MHFFSLNVPLGRESALFVGVKRKRVREREKSVTLMKKAAHPPAACDMKREIKVDHLNVRND